MDLEKDGLTVVGYRHNGEKYCPDCFYSKFGYDC